MPIRDEFSDEQLLHINTPTPWFTDICNFVATSQFLPEASQLYMERLQKGKVKEIRVGKLMSLRQRLVKLLREYDYIFA
ncbi:hypothetical protein CR513_57350, partial [Mucuna pruriens]